MRAMGNPVALEARAEDLEVRGLISMMTSLPSTAEEVVSRARAAWDAGLRGIVASPKEAGALRSALGPEATIVTPGVRPSWSGADDQARVMTPKQAIEAGADHIVVGRPIRNAADPREAARRIVEEMELAEVTG